jgi:hypothetical protein
MTKSLNQFLDELPPAVAMKVCLDMLHDLSSGVDPTIAALRTEADSLGVRLLLVGGVAVIMHGYRRTTDDRDVFVSYKQVSGLADHLMDHPEWERLEIRQHAFLHRPTGVTVDFLVSRDLIQWGRPYYFPDIESVEIASHLQVEGVPVIGLHDLLYFKLLAGRLQDMADIMQLCKAHLKEIDPQRVVGSLEKADDDLRQKFLELLRQAPIELANERRLGQGNPENYRNLD